MIVVGQLVGKPGRMRQQVTDGDSLSQFTSKLWQMFYHGIIEIENTSIVKSHAGCDRHRLGDGAQQECRPIGMSRSVVIFKRFVPDTEKDGSRSNCLLYHRTLENRRDRMPVVGVRSTFHGK